jgi:hypothetical protein
MFRALLILALSTTAAAPAAGQITRLSVSTTGVEADGFSRSPSMSADGRFVAFESTATNLVVGDTNGMSDVFVRDRDTDADGFFDEPGAVATTRISVGAGGAQADAHCMWPKISGDGRYVVFESLANTLVAGSNNQYHVYRVDRTTGAIIRVSETVAGEAGDSSSVEAAISDDGDMVAFASGAENLGPDVGTNSFHIFVRQVSAGRLTRLSPVATTPSAYSYFDPSISADGARVAYKAVPNDHVLVSDTATGDILARFATPSVVNVALSASGERIVIHDGFRFTRLLVDTRAVSPALMGAHVLTGTVGFASPRTRYALGQAGALHDFDLGLSLNLGLNMWGADFSLDDRWLTVASDSTTLVPGDVNAAIDVFVIDLPTRFDLDADTMDDRWEALFGVTDPSADPDADGATNAQEENAGTHPNGHVQRFLAEGATGTFFRTHIALANPSPTLDASAVVTFDRGDGTRIRRSIAVPAGRSALLEAGSIDGLVATDVSTTVESDRFLGIERSMTWGTRTGTIYGSHAERASPAPSATWILAEGSTVLGMDVFYMLQNPQATTTLATVRFLLPTGTVITRTYDLPPSSRTTIYVNQIAGLEETDVSGDITADAPIVVERAQYRSAPGQPFTLGHVSMGVPAPATSWFFAEGATGTFFDLFVLIANPGNQDARVDALYSRSDGTTFTRTYTIRAHSRFTVFVDAIPGLEHTALATALTSTVPIVAERAMYWPGGYFDYYEGHSSAGSTTTALDWVVAGAENGGSDGARTFILIANTENRAGQARVTVLPNVPTEVGAFGSPRPPPEPMVISLPANSRTTVPAAAINGPYGALVTSIGGVPVQIVVESAVYRTTAGVTWSAGSNALATPVP